MSDERLRVKVLYNKNLKMSEGKLASQVAHAVAGLHDQETGIEIPYQYEDEDIIVLGVSATKLRKSVDEISAAYYKSDYHIQRDLGKTEVEAGTLTALAFLESPQH